MSSVAINIPGKIAPGQPPLPLERCILEFIIAISTEEVHSAFSNTRYLVFVFASPAEGTALLDIFSSTTVAPIYSSLAYTRRDIKKTLKEFKVVMCRYYGRIYYRNGFLHRNSYSDCFSMIIQAL